MKNCIRTMFGILAIVLCLVAVQAADADEIDGIITKVYSGCAIDVVTTEKDTIKVQGLRFNYLDRQWGIVLEEGEGIRLEVYDVERGGGRTMTFACELLAYDGCECPIELRDCPE